MEGEMRRVSL